MAEDYVDKMAAISLLLAMLAMVGYFVYMMHNALMKTPLDLVVKFGLPMELIPLFAYFLTSEILGCGKFDRSRELCLKRFIGRVSLSLGILLPYILFLVLAIMVGMLDSAHAYVVMVILVGWSAFVFLIATTFREAIRKLTEGLW